MEDKGQAQILKESLLKESRLKESLLKVLQDFGYGQGDFKIDICQVDVGLRGDVENQEISDGSLSECEWQKKEGSQSKGYQSEGQQSEWQKKEGSQSKGQKSEGQQSEWQKKEGSQSKGYQSEGQQSEWQKSEGQQSERLVQEEHLPQKNKNPIRSRSQKKTVKPKGRLNKKIKHQRKLSWKKKKKQQLIQYKNYSEQKQNCDSKVYIPGTHFIYNPQVNDWNLKQLEKKINSLKRWKKLLKDLDHISQTYPSDKQKLKRTLKKYYEYIIKTQGKSVASKKLQEEIQKYQEFIRTPQNQSVPYPQEDKQNLKKEILKYLDYISKTKKQSEPFNQQQLGWLIIPDQLKEQREKRIKFIEKEYNILRAIKILEKQSRQKSNQQIEQCVRQQNPKYSSKIRENFIDNYWPKYYAYYTEKLLNLNQHHYQIFQQAIKQQQDILSQYGIIINYSYPIYPQLCQELYNACCRIYNIVSEYLDYHHQQHIGLLSTGSQTYLSILKDHVFHVYISQKGEVTFTDYLYRDLKDKILVAIERVDFIKEERKTIVQIIIENIYQKQEQICCINLKQVKQNWKYHMKPLQLIYNHDKRELNIQNGSQEGKSRRIPNCHL